MMDDPNITMEEYISLEEEKAQKHMKVFNWETAKYGKIWYNEDIYDLRSFEIEFPAIAFNDEVPSEKTLSCKPTVSSLNDEIDFRVSFDDSDDEDYTIYYENGMLFYLIMNLYVPFGISFDPKRCYKDGDCALMLRRPSFISSACSERLLLPPKQTPPEMFTADDVDVGGSDVVRYMAPLPPREQRHPFLRYQGLEYIDVDIADFEERLERIYSREIHTVQVIDFQGMSELMRDGLFSRMKMEHRDDASVVVFTSRAWEGGARRQLSLRQFILAIGLHTEEEMESLSFARDPVLRLCHRMMAHSIAERSQAPEKVIRGLTVIAPELPIIDMGELVRLQE
nr:hypothetical protein [Tanacetum cinerariifolium]